MPVQGQAALIAACVTFFIPLTIFLLAVRSEKNRPSSHDDEH